MSNLTKERLEICAACLSFSEEKACTAGCCPHVGKAEIESSRCPQNKWPDGWGETTKVKEIILENTDVEVVIVMDGVEIKTSKERAKKEISTKKDPLYVFQTEEEGRKFYELKNKLDLLLYQ